MKMRILMCVLALFAATIVAGAENDGGKAAEAAVLAASGKLRIIDSTGGDPAVRRCVLALAAANGKLNVELVKMPLLEAVEKATARDVIIFLNDPLNNFELMPEGEKYCYALDPAVIYVNSANPIDNLAVTALNSIFCGDVSSWDSLGGERRSIRRFAVGERFPGGAAFRQLAMGQLGLSDNLILADGARELVAWVASSPYSIGAGGSLLGVPEEVKALKINGVEPTAENFANGLYPLTLRRMAAVENGSENGRKFVEWLTSPKAWEALLEAGLAPVP